MVVLKCPPHLRRRPSAAEHVLADTRLTDVDARLSELAMNPRSPPERVLAAHSANQVRDRSADGTSTGMALSHLPGPEQAYAFAMITITV